MSIPEVQALNRSLIEVRDERDNLRQAHKDAKDWIVTLLEWIDAVPSDAPLPAMPGFDRDALDNFLKQ